MRSISFITKLSLFISRELITPQPYERENVLTDGVKYILVTHVFYQFGLNATEIQAYPKRNAAGWFAAASF